MKKIFSLLLCLCMILSILPTQFADVALDAYYLEPVKWAVERNITTGTSDVTFSPTKTCTRAQIVTFLWRAAQKVLI